MESWQTITMAVINILAIVASPIIAILISDKQQNKKDKRNDKLWILKILMTQRIPMNDINYVNALNLIDLIFVDSLSVRNSYKELLNSYSQKETDCDAEKISRAKTKLIETIIADIGYKDKITWDEIQQPYCPKWLLDDIDKKSRIINAQANVAEIIKSMPIVNNNKSNTEVKKNEQ